MEHTLDLALFREMFPELAAVPDARIKLAYGFATDYLGAYDGVLLSGDTLDRALYLLTAHIVFLGEARISGGGSSSGAAGPLTGATVDKVSVTFAAPTTSGGWQTWLALSPYGLMLWALLRQRSAGGFYVGGRPERKAFRKVGGRF